MVSIHDTAGLERLRRQWRMDPNLLRQVRNGFYKKQQSAAEALASLPPAEQAAFSDAVLFHSLQLHSRHDSDVDGASKLIFRTASGHLIESVILRIHSGRTSLCVSSQVGCAAKCRFCATGAMGIARNLTRDEILDQVIQANQILHGEGRAVRNVVFMGMGEPFHNEAEVFGAVELLLSLQCFRLSPARVLISTVGITGGMLRSAARFPQVGIALSLHSARQDVRERLIPLGRQFPLDLLRKTMEELAQTQPQPLMIEYLLLDGVNDSNEDLDALIVYLRDLRVHINLIPYNPIDDSELVGTPAERRREFAAALTNAGFTVTMRYSLGSDIAAACGQLVQRSNR